MKQRVFLLVFTALAAALLSACSASLVTDPGSGQPTIALHTIPTNLTPTPTAPAYTIGAWPSNPSPHVNDSITIYVIFHVGGRGVGGATVSLSFYSLNTRGNVTPVAQLNNQVSAQQTTEDGWAAFPLTCTGLSSQTPILVYVSVSYQGQSYEENQAATFFTPLQGSPTPTPSPTPAG
jgi:hypothetical protein